VATLNRRCGRNCSWNIIWLSPTYAIMRGISNWGNSKFWNKPIREVGLFDIWWEIFWQIWVKFEAYIIGINEFQPFSIYLGSENSSNWVRPVAYSGVSRILWTGGAIRGSGGRKSPSGVQGQSSRWEFGGGRSPQKVSDFGKFEWNLRLIS